MEPKWEFDCPLCKKHIISTKTIEEVRPYIHGTTVCPACNGVILINPDFTCSDFGEYLVGVYKGMGVNTSKEEALHNYVEVATNENSG